MNNRPLTIAIANSGRKWIGEVAHVAMLYQQLEAAGHRPWLICRQGFVLETRARENHWRHLSLRFNGSFNPADDLHDYRRWIQWARQENPDLLHCHRGKDHWLGCWVAKSLKCPLVRTRHVVTPVHPHFVNRWLYLRATQAIICVSQAARRSFGPWQEALPIGQVILSAVDTEKFHPGRRSEQWRLAKAAGPGEPLWFGLIGRLQNIKGQEIFLQAAEKVAQALPAAHFLIAGEGSASRHRYYREWAAQHGFAERLLVEGYLPDLPQVLASLDVGVIASLGSEGSSRIAMEMMASGLPLSTTNVGGIPDLLPSTEMGRLVPPGDPDALANAMLAWAGDQNLRQQAGLLARRQMLAGHQPQHWIQSILAVYQNVLNP